MKKNLFPLLLNVILCALVFSCEKDSPDPGNTDDSSGKIEFKDESFTLSTAVWYDEYESGTEHGEYIKHLELATENIEFVVSDQRTTDLDWEGKGTFIAFEIHVDDPNTMEGSFVGGNDPGTANGLLGDCTAFINAEHDNYELLDINTDSYGSLTITNKTDSIYIISFDCKTSAGDNIAGSYEGVITDRSLTGEYEPEDTIHIEVEYGEMSDIEGNKYKTVKIGDQWWMAENLKVTKYNDNTDIPYINDITGWENLKTGGMVWYDQDIDNRDVYGGLYNWYTVETGKLCPEGWHVPSLQEWEELVATVSEAGFEWKEGTALKSTSGWGENGNGTNKFGFNVMPAGNLMGTEFNGLGSFTSFWSSTSASGQYFLNAYRITFSTSREYTEFRYTSKYVGYSIRCVKD